MRAVEAHQSEVSLCVGPARVLARAEERAGPVHSAVQRAGPEQEVAQELARAAHAAVRDVVQRLDAAAAVDRPHLKVILEVRADPGQRGATILSFEDRQDLLGHRSARITTHYSAAELSKLIEAANRVCESDRRQPELVVLRRVSIA